MGEPAGDDRRMLTLRDIAGGSYHLSFGGATTGLIAPGAPANALQDALVALTSIGTSADGSPNIGVSKDGNTYTVEFINDKAGTCPAASPSCHGAHWDLL